MRPGQWLTRLSVYFDNRGVDGLVNTTAALIGGTSGRWRRLQNGFLLRAIHAGRRRGTGRLAPGGEALDERLSLVTIAGAVPLLGAIVIMLHAGLQADSAEADVRARQGLAERAWPWRSR